MLIGPARVQPCPQPALGNVIPLIVLAPIIVSQYLPASGETAIAVRPVPINPAAVQTIRAMAEPPIPALGIAQLAPAMTIPPAQPLSRASGETEKTAPTATSLITLYLPALAIPRELTVARGPVTAFIAGTVLTAI